MYFPDLGVLISCLQGRKSPNKSRDVPVVVVVLVLVVGVCFCVCVRGDGGKVPSA